MLRRVVGLGIILVATNLIGCVVATQADNEAPADILKPGGWIDVDSSLSGNTFDEYANNEHLRLTKYRIPVDPQRASIEIERAAPIQIDPSETCGDTVQGIAILVHGLADTAFSMHDLAESFAQRCYIARTVLLPGHGTRSGDMLVVNHHDWLATVRHLVKQAADEHDRVLLAGFSLGAVITLDIALDDDSPIDGLLAISPAYHISTWRLARYAPFVHRFYRWVDKGMAEDAQRYEAMPTRAVAEFVRASRHMHRKMNEITNFDKPWLLVHSLDDNTTVPSLNRNYVLERGPKAQVLEFYSDQNLADTPARVKRVSSVDETYRVHGLIHLAVHIAPENSHYGIDGDYRHCGTVDGRDQAEALRCKTADEVSYFDWDKLPPAGAPPSALSSFNPRYDELEKALDDFLINVEAQ